MSKVCKFGDNFDLKRLVKVKQCSYKTSVFKMSAKNVRCPHYLRSTVIEGALVSGFDECISTTRLDKSRG